VSGIQHSVVRRRTSTSLAFRELPVVVYQSLAVLEGGAKQIGQGQVGLGFRGVFAGIGHIAVEGVKFSGENLKELFTAKK
jgi:hypothetical protein